MKLTCTTLVLAVLCHSCISASVDLWSRSRPLNIPRNELIDPEEIKARLGKTPAEYKPYERHAGMVYFCYDENWGPPCYVYYPELEYTCSQLASKLSGHIGSVFVEPGAICRFAGSAENDRCNPIAFFAWPETQSGWSDLFHRDVPAGDGTKLGDVTKYFTCATCTNCI
ncbi:hypothetical protein B0J13DRAFT_540934 [Dactylonectria estremocensis]|uniref:Uncharacterized protein n=1 Tax=Dactylonectria estremocensis TaxID=1079267 RepID=A0A9P9FF44_9HYPO|nr:hypothetical protein B0J13DRAFT_540934 [Dactylonectria estremocensis]